MDALQRAGRVDPRGKAASRGRGEGAQVQAHAGRAAPDIVTDTHLRDALAGKVAVRRPTTRSAAADAGAGTASAVCVAGLRELSNSMW